MSKKKIVIKKPPIEQIDLFAETESDVHGHVKFTEEQRKFIEFDGKESIILAATAGSGKTKSCIGRLRELVNRGVDSKKIIFFSFTRAATEELTKRIGNSDIEVTTIHSFCMRVLAKCNKFKKIATFYDFVEWFKDKYKPHVSADSETKNFYYETLSSLYEEGDFLSSEIAAFKLQSADGIKCKVPAYISEYNMFLREKKSRDFSDMLIEVRDLFRDDKYLKMFRGQYDYIFVDEFQDTSLMQMQILLSMNAEHYYLIGDENQSIFGFSSSNVNAVKASVQARREIKHMSLSINFRSDKKIVANSNQFSSLIAKANSQEEGFVDDKVMHTFDEIEEILKLPEEVAILVRTNDVIKKLEIVMLQKRVSLKYFNFITPTDIKNFHEGNVHSGLKKKFSLLKGYFDSEHEIIHFIEQHKKSNKSITTIHKSKGREFDVCVVVNSLPPYLIEKNGIQLSKKQMGKVSFDSEDEIDLEPKNIHYVAVSRARKAIYFAVLLFV